MANNSSNDPRTIWQSQPTEPSEMTLEKIRQKVQELHSTTRRKLLGLYGGVLAIVALCMYGTRQFPSMQLLFVLPIVWGVTGLYFLNRGMWSPAMPGDAALITGIQFYRQEIERRRNLFRRLLLWSFAPVVAAIGAFILTLVIVDKDRSIFPNALPFLTMVVIWIGAYFVIRMREQRELQQEIESLKNIEKNQASGGLM